MGHDFRCAKPAVFRVRILTSLGLLILAVTLSSVLLGQISQGQTARDSKTVVHLPTDWSHHHLLFSSPATPEQLKRIQQDPRYWQQLFRRSQSAPPEATSDFWFGSPTSSKNHKLKRDWSVSMGTNATVGAGQYPGKFGFDVTTYSCADDFVVFNTGLEGSGTQASIIAYNNLYSGCGGTVPSVYWAYNTDGKITTSVTFSDDGTQLAFVQAPAAGHPATLVLLKWAASGGSATAPKAPTSETAGNYRNCTAPCMTTFAFKNSKTDTYSAPFYDFTPSSDALYVGDDGGYLHKFTGVFLGATPAESTTAPWPVTVGTTDLSSPVYDSTTGNVYVTASYIGGDGGQLAAVCATSTCGAVGTVTLSRPLTAGHAGSNPCNAEASGRDTNLQLDAPIVDPIANMVYAFVGNDGNANSAVYQFSTAFANATCGTEKTIGGGSTASVPVYAGTFDNAYFNSANGSSPSGNLYACSNTSGDATLYQVPISANVMGTAASVVPLTTAATTCSPVTEVYNGTNDLIFLSAEASAASPTCTAGCVYSTKVTPWQSLTAYAVGQEILDTHLQIQVVGTAGTSGNAAPTWTTTIGDTTTDSTVKWVNQGPLSTTISAPAFSAGVYGYDSQVIDGNGNIELCIEVFFGIDFPCFQESTPTWQTTPGATTTSGIATWENVGPNAIPALPAAGGTSGIIIDNTVPPGTIGTSQVYYSTLTGGTAVQASQSGLN